MATLKDLRNDISPLNMEKSIFLVTLGLLLNRKQIFVICFCQIIIFYSYLIFNPICKIYHYSW